MITNSGHSFTFEEAEKAGFFKGITDSFGDLLESVRKLNLKTDDFSIMSEESSEGKVIFPITSTMKYKIWKQWLIIKIID